MSRKLAGRADRRSQVVVAVGPMLCAALVAGLWACAHPGRGGSSAEGKTVAPDGASEERPAAPDKATELKVPARLSISRTEDRLEVSVDLGSLAPVSVELGKGHFSGFKHELRVYRDGAAVVSGRHGLSTSPDIGTAMINAKEDGIPKAGQTYRVEVKLELFETDVPPGHHWRPEGGAYRVLWSKTLSEVTK
jgi:hypothetical protein